MSAEMTQLEYGPEKITALLINQYYTEKKNKTYGICFANGMY